MSIGFSVWDDTNLMHNAPARTKTDQRESPATYANCKCDKMLILIITVRLH